MVDKLYLKYQLLHNGKTTEISELTEDEAKRELAKAIDLIEKLNNIIQIINKEIIQKL